MGDATQLYIPIVTVVGMLSGLLVIVWFAATKSTLIEIMREKIVEIDKQLADRPTRNEFTSILNTMEEVKKAIEDLRKELANK